MISFEKAFKKTKESYLALKLMQIRHRLVYEKSYKPMAQAMRRFKECDNKKPKSRIRKEMNLCRKSCYFRAMRIF